MRFEWQCLKRHTENTGLCMYGLDVWTLNSWTSDSWIWTTGHLYSGRLNLWTLDDSGLIELGRLYAWTLDNWTLELWTLGARKFFPFLVTSISFLLLVNVEFLIISSTLRLMYYGPVERAADDCYYTNLLRLIL